MELDKILAISKKPGLYQINYPISWRFYRRIFARSKTDFRQY